SRPRPYPPGRPSRRRAPVRRPAPQRHRAVRHRRGHRAAVRSPASPPSRCTILRLLLVVHDLGVDDVLVTVGLRLLAALGAAGLGTAGLALRALRVGVHGLAELLAGRRDLLAGLADRRGVLALELLLEVLQGALHLGLDLAGDILLVV